MMGIRLFKIAVVYFVVGVLLGMYMSMTHQFQFAPVHAHVNLLGWASMGLAGIAYYLFPKAAEHVLGKLHFWLHNIGLPVMMIGLFAVTAGHPSWEPVIAVGSIVTILGIVLFAVNVFVSVKESDSMRAPADR